MRQCLISPADDIPNAPTAGTFITATFTSARFPSAWAILARPRPGNGCAGYPGSNPGEQRGGTAGTFEQARAKFETAWRVFLPKRSEADFQAWRDQQAWTAEKYRRFDRGERMPPDWRVGEMRPPQG
jgi:hypothetical protein